MTDMREWDALIGEIAAIETPEDSLRKLMHVLADKIDELDFYRKNVDQDARVISDELADMSYVLEAKTEAVVEAILRKPRPKVIHLPDASDKSWAED